MSLVRQVGGAAGISRYEVLDDRLSDGQGFGPGNGDVAALVGQLARRQDGFDLDDGGLSHLPGLESLTRADL